MVLRQGAHHNIVVRRATLQHDTQGVAGQGRRGRVKGGERFGTENNSSQMLGDSG